MYCTHHHHYHHHLPIQGTGGTWGTGIVGNRSRSIPCYTRLDTCNLDAGCFDAVLGRASTWNEKCSNVCAWVCANKGQGPWVGGLGVETAAQTVGMTRRGKGKVPGGPGGPGASVRGCDTMDDMTS